MIVTVLTKSFSAPLKHFNSNKFLKISNQTLFIDHKENFLRINKIYQMIKLTTLTE